MNSFKVALDRRAAYVVTVFALVFAMIVPALASAAQITQRSITLSNSSAGTNGVTYQVDFTAASSAGAAVIEFCKNSPLIGAECTPPGDTFTAEGAAASGFTVTGTENKVTLVGAIASGPRSIQITGINNPDVAGTIYARILTYENNTEAEAYTSEDPGTGNSAPIDTGSVAIAITPTVGVQGAVMESLQFCIAKNAITKGCGNIAGAGQTPTLALGEQVGDSFALQPGVISSGSIFTQLTTNAVGGAIVNLKSAVDCGGLKRLGATSCDIAPALTNGLDTSSARFGLRTSAATDATDATGTEATGTLVPIGNYNNTTYALNYLANNTSGVTSTYGDPLFSSDDAPVNNKNMQLTFGASITNETPAGLYSADLSLIATGKF